MVSEETLVDMIRQQTKVNSEILHALKMLNKNTEEILKMANKNTQEILKMLNKNTEEMCKNIENMRTDLRNMDKTLGVVVEKYGHFSDYMKIIISLSVGQLFTLIGIAILL